MFFMGAVAFLFVSREIRFPYFKYLYNLRQNKKLLQYFSERKKLTFTLKIL